jgi:phage repressor protein C with HTH and peptisase S24 domain
MATRRDRSKELRELAQTFYRLMREHEIANTTRVKVSSALSRILKHDEGWRALRLRRKEGKRSEERVAKEPSFFTVVDAANELNVPICALVPTMEHQVVTGPQRHLLTLYARWALANFAPRDEERAAYTSDFEDFEAYVTIRKQAHTLAASPVGTDAQFEPEDAQVLEAIKGIRGERLQVIRIRGNSMADRLHDGDRVLIDIQLRTPHNGEMIAVDREHLGRIVGYWRREGKRCFLDKHDGATIDLGSPNDFSILGTITRIVDAPIRRRDRQ